MSELEEIQCRCGETVAFGYMCRKCRDEFDAINRAQSTPMKLIPLAEYESLTARAVRAERDTERLDWLGTHIAGDKWADVLPHLRPVDAHGEHTEKYIGGPDSLRAAIDAQRAPRPATP